MKNELIKTAEKAYLLNIEGWAMKSALEAYEASKEPVTVDLATGAKAIWDLEHEGRNNGILDVEWKLLKDDYRERAKACAEAWGLKYVD